MSGPVNISSAAEWQSLLSSNSVVIADFYADWCGPCKMIAPHFERLAQEHSRAKKMAFAKVNVDNHSFIARAQGVSAMPTFKVLHGGKCIDTIKGANLPALGDAVTKALKLADASPSGGSVFKTPGRTLGDASSPEIANVVRWSLSSLPSLLITFVGLYLVSLFSFDARKAADSSMVNVHKKESSLNGVPLRSGHAASRPAQKPTFKTIADLGSG